MALAAYSSWLPRANGVWSAEVVAEGRRCHRVARRATPDVYGFRFQLFFGRVLCHLGVVGLKQVE